MKNLKKIEIFNVLEEAPIPYSIEVGDKDEIWKDDYEYRITILKSLFELRYKYRNVPSTCITSFEIRILNSICKIQFFLFSKNTLEVRVSLYDIVSFVLKRIENRESIEIKAPGLRIDKQGGEI